MNIILFASMSSMAAILIDLKDLHLFLFQISSFLNLNNCIIRLHLWPTTPTYILFAIADNLNTLSDGRGPFQIGKTNVWLLCLLYSFEIDTNNIWFFLPTSTYTFLWLPSLSSSESSPFYSTPSTTTTIRYTLMPSTFLKMSYQWWFEK